MCGCLFAFYWAAFKCAAFSLQEFHLTFPHFINLAEVIITCPLTGMTTSSMWWAMWRPHNVQKQQGPVKLTRGKFHFGHFRLTRCDAISLFVFTGSMIWSNGILANHKHIWCLTCCCGVHDFWTNKISLWVELTFFLLHLCSGTSSWNLGEFNSKLSYYDGMIQLTYRNGSQYNNKRHTQRSTHISFSVTERLVQENQSFRYRTCFVVLFVLTVNTQIYF